MVAAVYFCVPSRSIRFVNSACNFCDCCQRPPAKRISIRTTSCSPALTTVNGTPFGKVVRTGERIWKFFRACISGCIVRSINQLLFFKNSSACSRSCGVSEKDYLYQLNLHTGEVIASLELKKQPDLLVPQDNMLYVHTYSYNYTIEMQ